MEEKCCEGQTEGAHTCQSRRAHFRMGNGATTFPCIPGCRRKRAEILPMQAPGGRQQSGGGYGNKVKGGNKEETEKQKAFSRNRKARAKGGKARSLWTEWPYSTGQSGENRQETFPFHGKECSWKMRKVSPRERPGAAERPLRAPSFLRARRVFSARPVFPRQFLFPPVRIHSLPGTSGQCHELGRYGHPAVPGG